MPDASIFLNEAFLLRLRFALLAEILDDGELEKIYFEMNPCISRFF